MISKGDAVAAWTRRRAGGRADLVKCSGSNILSITNGSNGVIVMDILLSLSWSEVTLIAPEQPPLRPATPAPATPPDSAALPTSCGAVSLPSCHLKSQSRGTKDGSVSESEYLSPRGGWVSERSIDRSVGRSVFVASSISRWSDTRREDVATIWTTSSS
jgi:hypothetical protein